MCMQHSYLVTEVNPAKSIPNYLIECKTDEEKKELRKKAEEYLARAERLKQQVKDQDGEI